MAAVALVALVEEAGAATVPVALQDVDLDPGDSGLVYENGVFRPRSGPDVYESKYGCKRVGPSSKNTETDSVERDKECPETLEPVDGLYWAETPAWSAPVLYWARSGGTWRHGNVGKSHGACCGGWHKTTTINETVTAVPLPASLWVLLGAIVALFGLRRVKQ